MLMKSLPVRPVPVGLTQSDACGQCAVRQHALFGVLDDEALARIHNTIASPQVEAEQPIYGIGEQPGVVFTIRSGIVRFERVTAGGVRRIVRLAFRGDLIGQEALLRQPYQDDAMACVDVTVCRIPVAMIDELGGAETELTQELMRRWQRALDGAESWTAELCAGPARRRVLMLLQLLQRHADGRGLVWLPRRDQMGDMLDMTVETASRIVSSLRRDGVLQVVAPQHARLDAGRLLAALARLDE